MLKLVVATGQDADAARQRARTDEFERVLRNSETGRRLLDKPYDIELRFEESPDSRILGYTDLQLGNDTPEIQKISLNADLSHEEAVVTLAHELAHARQINDGSIRNWRSMEPSDRCQFGRALEADAEATSMRVAAELHEKGQPQYLEHAKSLPEYREMAMVAEGVVRSPEFRNAGPERRSQQLDGLQHKVFEQWHRSAELREIYDTGSADLAHRDATTQRLPAERPPSIEDAIRSVPEPAGHGSYLDALPPGFPSKSPYNEPAAGKAGRTVGDAQRIVDQARELKLGEQEQRTDRHATERELRLDQRAMDELVRSRNLPFRDAKAPPGAGHYASATSSSDTKSLDDRAMDSLASAWGDRRTEISTARSRNHGKPHAEPAPAKEAEPEKK